MDIIDFLGRHWYLVAALAFFVAWLLTTDMMQRRRGIIAIEPQRAIRLMNDEQVQVYDIRSINEYQNGHISSAKHLDSDNLEKYIEEIKKTKRAPLIVCARGTSSAMIAGKLKKLGLETDVYALSGGMLKWTDDNLPVMKK